MPETAASLTILVSTSARLIDRFEQTLPRIGAEQFPRQKAMSETFEQAGIVFALIDLRERPVQKIPRAIRKNREVARSHVEKMQGMVTAIGGAPPQGGARLHNGKVERTRECRFRQAIAAAAPVKPPPITQIFGRVRFILFPNPVKAKATALGNNRRPWTRGGGLAAEGTIGPLYQSTWNRVPKPLIFAPSLRLKPSVLVGDGEVPALDLGFAHIGT